MAQGISLTSTEDIPYQHRGDPLPAQRRPLTNTEEIPYPAKRRSLTGRISFTRTQETLYQHQEDPFRSTSSPRKVPVQGSHLHYASINKNHHGSFILNHFLQVFLKSYSTLSYNLTFRPSCHGNFVRQFFFFFEQAKKNQLMGFLIVGKGFLGEGKGAGKGFLGFW